MTLIGSASMDRRSLELNYEHNILCHDPGLTGEVRRNGRLLACGSPVLK